MSSGDHSKVEPPGSIPNPEVKHLCADGSVAKGHVRVGRCQNYIPAVELLFPAGFLCLAKIDIILNFESSLWNFRWFYTEDQQVFSE